MELRHLRYFVAVAEQGNVSRAARKLFIAQPPLSAQLRQLEEEVGAALFTRLPRGVRLTPAGESFLEDARAILARAQQAPLRARERQHSRQSVVRLALVPSAMHSVLPGLLRRIADAGWLLRVEAREMITSQQLRALRAGELDLGLGRPGREETLPEEVAGMDDPYCLAVAPANPLAAGEGPLPLQAAAHEAFVGFSRYEDADYFDRTVALCLDAGFTPSIRHEAGQFVNVLALVACGLGWPSFLHRLPRCTVANWSSGRCRHLPTRAAWQCWPPCMRGQIRKMQRPAMRRVWRRLLRWSCGNSGAGWHACADTQ